MCDSRPVQRKRAPATAKKEQLYSVAIVTRARFSSTRSPAEKWTAAIFPSALARIVC